MSEYRRGLGLRVRTFSLEHAPTWVYLLFLGDEFVYVGITGNLARRIRQHRSEGKVFDDVYILDFPNRVEAEVEETRIIAQFRPSLNRWIPRTGYQPWRAKVGLVPS